MSGDVTRSFRNIFSKIEKATEEAISKTQMGTLAEFAVGLIVKRTRLGFGVAKQFGEKKKLKPLSKGYIKQRKADKKLSSATSPGLSNLTRTGQLLDSVKVIRATNGSIRFGPTGTRKDGLQNARVAYYQELQGRPFNRISALEWQQVLRFYRREFGDLLKKRKLLK